MKDFVRKMVECAWQLRKPADGKKHMKTEAKLAMQSFLQGLIEQGFEFQEDDFAYFRDHCGFSLWGYRCPYRRWFEVDEDFYRIAINSKNFLACKSFEKFKDRPALYAPDQVDRIYVGQSFEWQGEIVGCSSFNEQRGFITIMPVKDVRKHTHRRIRWSELRQE